MTTQTLVISPDGRNTPLNVVGEHVTVLAPRGLTSGHEFFLQEGAEGSGPPPHRHDWDESFYVLEGAVDFGSGDAVTTAGPGTLVHIPAGTVHWFRFGKGGARMLSVTGDGSRAAAMFTEFDREIPPGPPDVPKLVEVAARHGVSFELD